MRLIIASDATELEKFWATEIGERYWALVRSGIQNEPLGDSDQLRKVMPFLLLTLLQVEGFRLPTLSIHF